MPGYRMWRNAGSRAALSNRPIDLDRGHPTSKARRAIDALLPGHKYVLATGHDASFVHSAVYGGGFGPKRFSTEKLPCGRVLVTRTR
jgi:hypothetical protein